MSGKRCIPVPVHLGLGGGRSDLLSDPIRPGDALVTSVVLRQRSRT